MQPLTVAEENCGYGYELANLTGRDIDLVEKRAIENSDNWLRRDEILNTAQVIYSHTYVSA